MATILITGGTGLIGTALTKVLVAKGHQVIILSRRPKPAEGNISYAAWDLNKHTIDANAIQAADYIIHLAGAGVANKRWTAKYKKEIMDSRVKSGELIANALKEHPNKVKAVISSGGISWYGADEDRTNGKAYFSENDPPADDFLAQVCVEWERAISQVNTRLVVLRVGPVFSNEGGAFVEFKKPVRMGVAAILGSGKQMISWIHVDDIVRMFIFAMENEQVQGTYNAVSPQPISNKNLMLMLAQKMKGRFYVPVHVPAFALKLFAGGVSVEVLRSSTIGDQKIREAGFQFLYPSPESAINNLIGRPSEIS